VEPRTSTAPVVAASVPELAGILTDPTGLVLNMKVKTTGFVSVEVTAKLSILSPLILPWRIVKKLAAPLPTAAVNETSALSKLDGKIGKLDGIKLLLEICN
jgi:hypothetical protein